MGAVLPLHIFLVNAFDICFVNERGRLQRRNKPDFAKAVSIAPKQTVKVEIPVEMAQNFGLTLMTLRDVSATLFNDKGIIVGKNLTKTLEANTWFRSIYVDKEVTAGTRKLKLETASDKELEAVLATWKNAVK